MLYGYYSDSNLTWLQHEFSMLARLLCIVNILQYFFFGSRKRASGVRCYIYVPSVILCLIQIWTCNVIYLMLYLKHIKSKLYLRFIFQEFLDSAWGVVASYSSSSVSVLFFGCRFSFANALCAIFLKRWKDADLLLKTIPHSLLIHFTDCRTDSYTDMPLVLS